MSGGMSNVPKRLWFGCFMQTLTLGIGIVLTMHMFSVGKVGDQNTITVSEITQDWTTAPFVAVRVTDDKCTTGEASIFARKWGGTEQGCLVNKIEGLWGTSSKQEVMTVADYDSYI